LSNSLIRTLSAAMMLGAGAWAAAQFEPAPPVPGSELPEVVAIVAGEPVTRDFLVQALNASTRRLLSSPQAQQQGITRLTPQQQRMVLESIINNRVALHLANEAGVTVDEAEIDAYIENERKRFPSVEIFEDFLRSEGITEEIMRERTHEMLMIQEYREQVTADITVSEEEVREHYEALRDDGRMNAPKTWNFRHILIRTDPADEESHADGEARIQAIHARLVGGEDFAALAEEVSDDFNSRETGGLYRNVPRGRGIFEESFEERALSVPVGELSEPFSTAMGWHLVFMEAEHEAGLMAFERVSDSLENQILTNRQQTAFQERLQAARDTEVEVELFLGTDTAGPPPAAPAPAPSPAPQPGGSAIDDLLRQLDDGS
jgi:foldase protein PrsA